MQQALLSFSFRNRIITSHSLWWIRMVMSLNSPGKLELNQSAQKSMKFYGGSRDVANHVVPVLESLGWTGIEVSQNGLIAQTALPNSSRSNTFNCVLTWIALGECTTLWLTVFSCAMDVTSAQCDGKGDSISHDLMNKLPSDWHVEVTESTR